MRIQPTKNIHPVVLKFPELTVRQPKTDNPKLRLVRTNSDLVIVNSTRTLETKLGFMKKSLVQDPQKPWERKTKKTRVDLFEVLNEAGPRVVVCPQGLWRVVRLWAKSKDIDVLETDDRPAFPAPRLDLIKGLRFSQKPLVCSALLANTSGLIKAPTRYGKSRLIFSILRAFPGVRTVVVTPGVDLIEQTLQELKAHLPGRDIVLLGGGSRVQTQGPDITLCSMDSMHKCDHSQTQLVIVDEPHMVVTDSRAPELAKFVHARKYGLGATLSGRFDQADLMIEALIGPILAEITYRQAVAEGAILQIVAFMIEVKFDYVPYSNRDQAYRHIIYNNGALAGTIAKVCDEILPEDWQTIVFISNEKQALQIANTMSTEVIAMDKRLTKKERKEMMRQMASNTLKRCVSSEILSTGVTFPDLRAIVMAAGGGGSITAIQKPGRLAQVMPGKSFGYLIDFRMVPRFKHNLEPGSISKAVFMVLNDSRLRQAAYEDLGYKVEILNNVDELPAALAKWENKTNEETTAGA